MISAGAVVELKKQIRRRIQQQVRAIPPEERQQSSRWACDRLQQQEVWRRARAVLLYASLPDEVDVWPLLNALAGQGKTTALPRFNPEERAYEICQIVEPSRDLPAGKFGILEPKRDAPLFPAKQLDLVLVPGVAFDRLGRRLGRGKGYYDRLLVGVGGSRCGVAFDQQVESELPSEEHDVRMDFVLTPTRWLTVDRGRGTQ